MGKQDGQNFPGDRPNKDTGGAGGSARNQMFYMECCALWSAFHPSDIGQPYTCPVCQKTRPIEPEVMAADVNLEMPDVAPADRGPATNRFKKSLLSKRDIEREAATPRGRGGSDDAGARAAPAGESPKYTFGTPKQPAISMVARASGAAVKMDEAEDVSDNSLQGAWNGHPRYFIAAFIFLQLIIALWRGATLPGQLDPGAQAQGYVIWLSCVANIVLLFVLIGPLTLRGLEIARKRVRFVAPGGEYFYACALAAVPAILASATVFLPEDWRLSAVFFLLGAVAFAALVWGWFAPRRRPALITGSLAGGFYFAGQIAANLIIRAIATGIHGVPIALLAHPGVLSPSPGAPDFLQAAADKAGQNHDPQTNAGPMIQTAAANATGNTNVVAAGNTTGTPEVAAAASPAGNPSVVAAGIAATQPLRLSSAAGPATPATQPTDAAFAEVVANVATQPSVHLAAAGATTPETQPAIGEIATGNATPPPTTQWSAAGATPSAARSALDALTAATNASTQPSAEPPVAETIRPATQPDRIALAAGVAVTRPSAQLGSGVAMTPATQPAANRIPGAVAVAADYAGGNVGALSQPGETSIYRLLHPAMSAPRTTPVAPEAPSAQKPISAPMASALTPAPSASASSASGYSASAAEVSASSDTAPSASASSAPATPMPASSSSSSAAANSSGAAAAAVSSAVAGSPVPVESAATTDGEDGPTEAVKAARMRREAQQDLQMAIACLKAGNVDAGRDRLQAIIDKCPDTPAAQQASFLLEKTPKY